MTHPPAYDQIGIAYAPNRRPDARLACRLWEALGPSSSVVNVGAGTGSYEPIDRDVIAVEPSRTMLRQRPAGSAPAVVAYAESLPIVDRSVDAAMALLTIHHWNDLEAGFEELKRVSRRRIVLLTIDPDVLSRHWMVTDYAPEIMDTHGVTLPRSSELRSMLPGATVSTWLVPRDCTDLFFVALWGRPELYLEAAVRAATSVWHLLPAEVVARMIERLRQDLASGRWDNVHGALRSQPALDVGVRIVTADLEPIQDGDT